MTNNWMVHSYHGGDPLVRSYEAGMARLEGLEQPQVLLRRPLKEIVLEGALGAVALIRYWPVLRSHIQHRSIRLWAVDTRDPRNLALPGVSGGHVGRRQLENVRNFLKEAQNLGVAYLDKTNPKDLRIYENLAVDGVIVATPDETHCGIAEQWIGRTKALFIEKPVDCNVVNVERFQEILVQNGSEMWAWCFDHYRTKALPCRQQIRSVLAWLGDEPSEITFYLLEPQTIEEEGRSATLKRGLTLDLFPHCLALIMYFGDPATFQVEGDDAVKVGRYDGASIDNETFAAIDFSFKTHGSGRLVKGKAYIGKGVGGVRRLERAGAVFEAGPPKLLVIQGVSGGKVYLDFVANTLSIEKDGQERAIAGLMNPPHNTLVDSFVFERLPWDHSCFSIESGKVLVAKINALLAARPKVMPTYQSGDFLEDILTKASSSRPNIPGHFSTVLGGNGSSPVAGGLTLNTE